MQHVVQEARDARLDFAEGKLDEKIDNGDTAALIFFLKTQGRSRGYGQDESSNKEQKIKIVIDENNVGMREELERVQQRNKASSE